MSRPFLSSLLVLSLAPLAVAGGPPVTADDLAALRPAFAARDWPVGVAVDAGADLLRALRGDAPRPALVLLGHEPRLFDLLAYEGHHQCSLPYDSEDLLGRTVLPRLFDLFALTPPADAAPALLVFNAAGRLTSRIALGAEGSEQALDHAPIFRALKAALAPKAWKKITESGPALIRDFLYYRFVRWQSEGPRADRSLAESVKEEEAKIKAREAHIGLLRSLLNQPFRQAYDFER